MPQLARTTPSTTSQRPPKIFALAPLQIDVLTLIPDEAFERERLVIIEEIRRSEDNPHRRFSTGNADSV